MTDEPNLFAMTHANPLSTEVDAARTIGRRLNELHDRVLAALRRGPMTDADLEELPEFAGFGPATIRKRRSELFQMGRLTIAGERKNKRGRTMKVWAIK